MATLVNIRTDEYGGNNAARLVKALQTEETPAHKALREAAEEFWFTAGSRKVCGDCFAGKLEHSTHTTHGCCGGCPALSDEGCVQKNAMCAAFGCSHLKKTLIPEELKGEAYSITDAAARFDWYYTEGFIALNTEAKAQVVMQEQAENFRKLTARLKEIQAHVRERG